MEYEGGKVPGFTLYVINYESVKICVIMHRLSTSRLTVVRVNWFL